MSSNQPNRKSILLIACFLIAAYIFLSWLSRQSLTSTLRDPTSHVNVHVTSRLDNVDHHEVFRNSGSGKHKRLFSKFHATASQGGIGNTLFEMSNLLGFAGLLNRHAFLDAFNVKVFREISSEIWRPYPIFVRRFGVKFVADDEKFYNVSFPKTGVQDFWKLEAAEKHQNILIDAPNFQSFKYFWHMRQKIREYLAPRASDSKLAAGKLEVVVNGSFLICVHTRFLDPKKIKDRESSDPVFTRNATDFLVREYQKTQKNVNVALLGNDLKSASAIFKDSPKYKVGISKSSADHEVDMAFSRNHCDVILLTVPMSKFGWWLAFNSKNAGSTVYYRSTVEIKDKNLENIDPEDYFPTEWRFLTSHDILGN